MPIIKLKRTVEGIGKSTLNEATDKDTTTQDSLPLRSSEIFWALFHEVWGESKEGKYDKRKWGELQEMIQELEKKGGDKHEYHNDLQ